MSYCCG
jgi:RNA polymerase sigma-70 factor, ECF subfamily